MWELSIIVSVLGTAFFLVYLSRSIGGDNDNLWLQGMKTFLVLVALVILLLNVAMPYHILDGAEEFETRNMTTETKAKIVNTLDTNLTVTMWTFIFFMVLFTMYFFVSIAYEISGRRKERKEE